jgi:hypothetical protein
MKIPNMKEISTEAMVDAINQVKRESKKIIFQLLGFDTSWHDIRVKDNSAFVSEIVSTPEYIKFKKDLFDTCMAAENFKLSATERNKLVRDVKATVMWEIERRVKEELTSELLNQAFEEIKKDPRLNPIMIAASMTGNKK